MQGAFFPLSLFSLSLYGEIGNSPVDRGRGARPVAESKHALAHKGRSHSAEQRDYSAEHRSRVAITYVTTHETRRHQGRDKSALRNII